MLNSESDEIDDSTKPEINWLAIKTQDVFPSSSDARLPPESNKIFDQSATLERSAPPFNSGKRTATDSSPSDLGPLEITEPRHRGQASPPPLNQKHSDIPTVRDVSENISSEEIGASIMETTMAGVFSKASDSDNRQTKSHTQPQSHIFEPGNLVLGKYHVVEKLQVGGFGQIYLVVDEEDYLKPVLVMKIIPMEMFSPTSFNLEFDKLKSIYKQWKVISDTYPENVVRLLGIRKFEAFGQEFFCLLMEYLPGGSLQDLVGEWHRENTQLTPLQITQIVNYFKQICESVYVLHKNNLLHRDIKPANVLFDKEREKSKLCDFELLYLQGEQDKDAPVTGTILYMPPEAFLGNYSVASDIFALGASLYYCLAGKYPFGTNYSINDYLARISSNDSKPLSLTEVNPLIPAELNQIALRCLELKPEDRPTNVKEVLSDLNRFSNYNEDIGASPLNNSAPVSLAKLLLEVLPIEDREFLVNTLRAEGYRSRRELDTHQEEDMIEEYCYTVDPDKILREHLPNRQLVKLMTLLKIDLTKATSREEMIREILSEIGFLCGTKEVPGLEATRVFLENSLNNFANVTTSEECLGLILSAFTSLEIAIDLLVRFYGQLYHGASFETILAREANGKKSMSRWTFGEKTKILRSLYDSRSFIPERAQNAFKEKFFDKQVFTLLEEVSKRRNSLAHQSEILGFNEIRKTGKEFLTIALETIRKISESKNVPRAVQIVSLHHDVYGRHFYHGIDDRKHTERIYTPLPLQLGEIYLFFPLTNPARINPLIFPYKYKKGK